MKSDVAALLSTAVTALGGAERSGQIEMAEAVGYAFDHAEHLAVQAGTGTGKSLAYLVPSIAHAMASNRPVVVSTATIALQRQLVDRDLPRLADALAPHLGRRPEFALLKVFLKNQGQHLGREELIQSVWGSRQVSKNALDTHLVNLKRKLPVFANKLVLVYGSGYCYEH